MTEPKRKTIKKQQKEVLFDICRLKFLVEQASEILSAPFRAQTGIDATKVDHSDDEKLRQTVAKVLEALDDLDGMARPGYFRK